MKRKIVLFVFLVSMVFPALAQDKVIDVLNNELQRNWNALKKEKNAPYFISYRVNDIKSFVIKSSFGDNVIVREKRDSRLCVHVRVGSPKLDNTHPIKGDDFSGWTWDTGLSIPFDANADGVNQIVWLETDKKYKDACDKFAKVQANIAVKVEDEDKSEDFTKEEPVVYYEAPLDESKIVFDTKLWEDKLNKFSAIFLENKELQEGSAYFVFNIERKYFVSTEGSKITENRLTCRLMLNSKIQAEDGMELPLYESFFAFEPNQLPADSVIIKAAKRMVAVLGKLKTAPVVDSYTGPALLAPASAGVFFHEIFGHRIEAQRMKNESDAQTFKQKVGQKVLNENLSIIFDPSIEKYKNLYMNGAYKFDDQGIKGSKTVIIENGTLRNFLVSRTPITGFNKSNGHGRAQEGMQPVSRQSNMFVETSKPYSDAELREMLKIEAKKQGKEYGYLFVNTVGGFTMTGRYIPNAFNVTPVEVYRVYVDGKPDELVRGVDLVGTPLSIFSNIEAAGNTPDIFTGTCGAESGGVPTTTVCPTLFVKQIETQRKAKNQDKTPILSRP